MYFAAASQFAPHLHYGLSFSLPLLRSCSLSLQLLVTPLATHGIVGRWWLSASYRNAGSLPSGRPVICRAMFRSITEMPCQAHEMVEYQPHSLHFTQTGTVEICGREAWERLYTTLPYFFTDSRYCQDVGETGRYKFHDAETCIYNFAAFERMLLAGYKDCIWKRFENMHPSQ
jgi:hypothetical protein